MLPKEARRSVCSTGLPERTCVRGEWEQRDDGCAHRDQHGAQPNDSGTQHRHFERLAFPVPFRDEVEQLDDVTDDDAGQTD